jgi:hypothetical protein
MIVTCGVVAGCGGSRDASELLPLDGDAGSVTGAANAGDPLTDDPAIEGVAHDPELGPADPGAGPMDPERSTELTMPESGETPSAPIDNASSVTFDPPGGGFSDSMQLRLRAGGYFAGAELHYTLDGSVPTADSPLYSEPIGLSATTLVRARALRDDDSSATFNQSYVRVAADAQSADSNLPLMVVHMLGNAAPDPFSHEFMPATFELFDASTGRARLVGPATWSGRLGVKVRGRTSRMRPKHNYTIEVRGDDEDDLKLPLLGMPPEGDWVLYAPYDHDRVFVRNALMYELSRRIGRYAPRTRFCELYFVADHSDLRAADYAGVYVLMERITRGDDRVDVAKLKPTTVSASGVTGGYIFQIDVPDVPEEQFSAANLNFVYVDPGYDEITSPQRSYLTEYLDSWGRAIRADDGVDPVTSNRFDALMDTSSFIDHHILNMLAKNPDAFELSTYFYKDRGGPLNAGPLWDMELGVGNPDDVYEGQARSVSPAGWGPGSGDGLFMRAPYDALFEHQEFVEAYWSRLNALLDTTLSADAVRSLLASYAAELREAEPRNSARWPEMAPLSGSLDGDIDSLGAWVDARLQWMRTQIGTLP